MEARPVRPSVPVTRRARVPWAAILLLGLLAGFLGAGAFQWLVASRSPAALAPPVPAAAVGDANRLTLSPLVARTAPAVVNIAVLQASPQNENPLLRDPFWRRYFGVPEDAPRLAAGSGVIVDAERGLVLTNVHVVQNARAIQVTLNDRRQVEAELLGGDPRVDIAVLRIPARNLTQLPLGDSERLAVGDYVVAIGDPFQVGQTVTAGIVSALGRGPRGRGTSYVQTDAPINPGNSGGPLIDMRGQVIGINTAIVGPAGGNVGIGFAVPSNTARRVMEQVVGRGG
ncbi:trypsin-like peptidase domain-containing protein [Sphingomonas lenta]|uniref:Trypsin n=1 Tax=Sphingomonas lenta TaxID=1141887 RepID=A0A2A2SBK3_9SPHN|nr:trypsin-like peptidase domain-containing protein [Sphingomonas lenta]PAX06552.1 trypsin [Sphingomonas lenta]